MRNHAELLIRGTVKGPLHITHRRSAQNAVLCVLSARGAVSNEQALVLSTRCTVGGEKLD